MAQTTTSAGLSRGRREHRSLMLPASLHKDVVFLLLPGGAWTQPPFEQAVAGPRCKWPGVQSMDHPLPPIRWRPQGGLNAPHSQPPSAIRAEAWLATSAAKGCGKAVPMALGQAYGSL